jgi:PucR C-terminal helix-turn-helix domain/GGDEF-like domain
VLTLGRLAERLGPTLVRVSTAPRGLAVPVEEVVVQDPTDPVRHHARDLAVGIGVSDPQALSLLSEMEGSEGTALVLKRAVDPPAYLREAASRVGVALLTTHPGASWEHLLTLLRGALAERGSRPQRHDPEAIAAGDLFALANAVAAIAGGPVTIEDSHFRLLAFSSDQTGADDIRSESILGRGTPRELHGLMRRLGLLPELYRQRTPIFVPPTPDRRGRLVTPIRAGAEFLGAIFALVDENPPSERLAELEGAAATVALHVLGSQIAAEVRSGRQSELTLALLEARPGAREAARQLRLEGGGSRVLAVGPAGQVADGEAQAGMRACWDLLSLQLGAARHRAATALLGDTVYAVVATRDSTGELHELRQLAERFVERVCSRGHPVAVGIGGAARTLGDVPASRRQADQALAVARDGPGAPVAAVEEVQTEVLLMRLREARPQVPGGGWIGRIERLAAADRAEGTRYVETLQAFFDSLGSVRETGRRLGVHHNTCRNRLRKIGEICGVDLDRARDRFGLELELRVGSATRDRPGTSNRPSPTP